jgi:prepilin-type N-terminal cleavage/methylation domain-containing protein
MKNSNSGFTLVELILVIAIIGVLSSIVLASLNNARNRAKDVAIKMEVAQLVNLATIDSVDTGSYCNFQGDDTSSWITAMGETCEDSFTGSLMTQSRQLCHSIFDKSGPGTIAGLGSGYKIYTSTWNAACGSSYSFMVALNNGNWYCSGSSGSRGEYTAYSNVLDGSHLGHTTPGCYMQP